VRLEQLRALAVDQNFSSQLPLREAIEQLGFVQADPIRSPARAQDLILRQRVAGYQAGDLEAGYSALELEEDFLYAYGFMPRDSTWRFLHPRKALRLTVADRRVLDLVQKLGEAHPSQVAAQLGRKQAVNAWGGLSSATTRTLHHLHWHGLLRVSRREGGTRVYMPFRAPEQPASPTPERVQRIVMRVANIFAPIPEASFRQVQSLLTYCHLSRAQTNPALAALLKRGELVKIRSGEIDYLVPADAMARTSAGAPTRVRMVAPFDPLVWDRRRFEHLWGWTYRFEAYTPAPKRQYGYYAMPLLWRDQIIGWVNAKVNAGAVSIEPGYVAGKPPQGSEYRHALEEETTSLANWLRR
jgi:uncharacterized protein